MSRQMRGDSPYTYKKALERIAELESSNQRLREALLNLNSAIDYHWNDNFTGVQRMPDAHAKMIVAAQQVAKKALQVAKKALEAIRKEIT